MTLLRRIPAQAAHNERIRHIQQRRLREEQRIRWEEAELKLCIICVVRLHVFYSGTALSQMKEDA